MKKKNCIKLLSAIMSLVIVCGLLSPAMVSATSGNAYINGLQNFFDDGNHTQLVSCPDAVYMEYAEQLRTNPVGSISMSVLGFIYGGLDFKEKVEPNKDRYKEALLNIIRTYEEENAEAITQQNLLDDTKALEDYLQDVADMGLSWLGAVGTNIKLETGEEVLPEDVNMAVSIINQIPKESKDWAKGASTLKTTLQLYEKHDIFLRAVEENATGALKEAAGELRADQSRVVKAHLRAYLNLSFDSATDYAMLFYEGIWQEDWINYLDGKIPAVRDIINKVASKLTGESSGLTYFQAFQAAKLGVDIGKLSGNILINAEDILYYIVEIKAVHDISVVLENEMDVIMNIGAKATKTDAQNYIAYGNYLISSRIRGQYCMTAIYLQPQMQLWLKDSDVENAKSLYNRLTTKLFDTQKNLDAICSGTSMTPVLSGIEADSIQYYNCSESGNFSVIEKNGKYGIIGYDSKILLPIEYDEIYQGRGHSYDYLWASKGDYFYSIDINGKAEESWGYPGGDVDPDAYWYNGQLAVFMPGEGIIGGVEELSWIAIEQRSWKENAVLPIQEMAGITENEWGMKFPKIENAAFALLDITTGQLVSDFVYSGFDTGNGFSEGVLAVKKGDKWGFIDAKGNEITDFLYDPYEQNNGYEDMEYKYSIFTAANGYIAVLKDGKWGLIDIQGNTVVEPSYDGISQVNPDGMFWLKENGTWSLYQLGDQ